MKIMKILEFNMRITKIIKILEFPQIIKKNENSRTPCMNYENQEKIIISNENHKKHENIRISLEN